MLSHFRELVLIFLGLAPIAVLPEYQRQSLGSWLIQLIKHEQSNRDWNGWDSYDGNAAEELPYGNDKVHEWRRSYSVRPPGGESLEDTQKRAIAYFKNPYSAALLQGENVLIAAHGNSLRSIIMMLDRLSPDEVTALELATGVSIVYDFDASGEAIAKKILND